MAFAIRDATKRLSKESVSQQPSIKIENGLELQKLNGKFKILEKIRGLLNHLVEEGLSSLRHTAYLAKQGKVLVRKRLLCCGENC